MTDMEKSPVNRIILITGFLGLLQGIQRFLIPVALIHNGWSLSQYTWVFVFQAFAMIIPMFFGGVVSDVKGRKAIIGISFLMNAFGSLLFMIALGGTSIVLILIAQIMSTISFGTMRIGLSALMADETIEGFDRTNSLGKQASFRNLAAFFGPFTMGFYLTFVDFDFGQFHLGSVESGFFILAILSSLGIFSMFFLPQTSGIQIQRNKHASLADFSRAQRKMQKAFGIEEIIIGFTSGIIVPLIDWYILNTFHPSNLAWGIVFGLSNSSIAIGSYFVGRYAERFGKANLVMIINGFAPLLAIGIAFMPTFSLVAVFYVLRSGFANAVQPAWESWYFVHTPATIRGRGMSTIQISRRLSRGLGVASGPIAFTIIGTALFPLACLFYPFAMSIPRRVEINLNSHTLDTEVPGSQIIS